MSNETVYVAIGIACVVAVLLFIVFIIYCVKRHNDKLYNRQARERRQREERHRRHLRMGHMVRPPPYDPNGPRLDIPYNRQLPFTPPPAYKEVATPMPRNGAIVGLGDLPYGPPVYDYPANDDIIPTVARRVPLNYTNVRGERGNNNNRTSNMNAINSLRARPLTSPAPPVIVLPPDPARAPPPHYWDSGRNGEAAPLATTRRELTVGTNLGEGRRAGNDRQDPLQSQQPQLIVNRSAVLAHSYNSGGRPETRTYREPINNNSDGLST